MGFERPLLFCRLEVHEFAPARLCGFHSCPAVQSVNARHTRNRDHHQNGKERFLHRSVSERQGSEAVKKLIAEIVDFTKRSRSLAGGAKIRDRQKDSIRPPRNYYSAPIDVFLFLGHLDSRV
jgi:hypothetical protein